MEREKNLLNNESAKLTCIVPVTDVYYRIRFVEEWISLLPSEIEIVIVHDTENENEKRFLKNRIPSSDRIQLICSNFGSPGASRNAGLKMVKTEFTMFWDSDDIPVIRNIIRAIDEFDSATEMIIGGFSTFNENSNEEKKIYECSSKFRFVAKLGLWRIIFRTEIIKNFEFTNFKMGEDQLFVAEILSLKPKIRKYKEIIYKYNISDHHQLTSSFYNKNDLLQIIELMIQINNKSMIIDLLCVKQIISLNRITGKRTKNKLKFKESINKYYLKKILVILIVGYGKIIESLNMRNENDKIH